MGYAKTLLAHTDLIAMIVVLILVHLRQLCDDKIQHFSYDRFTSLFLKLVSTNRLSLSNLLSKINQNAKVNPIRERDITHPIELTSSSFYAQCIVCYLCIYIGEQNWRSLSKFRRAYDCLLAKIIECSLCSAHRRCG